MYSLFADIRVSSSSISSMYYRGQLYIQGFMELTYAVQAGCFGYNVVQTK
jgi:hypothetical protein